MDQASGRGLNSIGVQQIQDEFRRSSDCSPAAVNHDRALQQFWMCSDGTQDSRFACLRKAQFSEFLFITSDHVASRASEHLPDSGKLFHRQWSFQVFHDFDLDMITRREFFYQSQGFS